MTRTTGWRGQPWLLLSDGRPPLFTSSWAEFRSYCQFEFIHFLLKSPAHKPSSSPSAHHALIHKTKWLPKNPHKSKSMNRINERTFHYMFDTGLILAKTWAILYLLITSCTRNLIFLTTVQLDWENVTKFFIIKENVVIFWFGEYFSLKQDSDLVFS